LALKHHQFILSCAQLRLLNRRILEDTTLKGNWLRRFQRDDVACVEEDWGHRQNRKDAYRHSSPAAMERSGIVVRCSDLLAFFLRENYHWIFKMLNEKFWKSLLHLI
jgi:hypothetical protein